MEITALVRSHLRDSLRTVINILFLVGKSKKLFDFQLFGF